MMMMMMSGEDTDYTINIIIIIINTQRKNKYNNKEFLEASDSDCVSRYES